MNRGHGCAGRLSKGPFTECVKQTERCVQGLHALWGKVPCEALRPPTFPRLSAPVPAAAAQPGALFPSGLNPDVPGATWAPSPLPSLLERCDQSLH